jgi:branched-chain amino acid transport system permease protein
MTKFLQLVVVGLSSGSAYALVGIGMVLVHRTTGIVNFSVGVFPVIGGLLTASMVADGWPVLPALLVAIAAAFAAGTLVGLLAIGQRGRTTRLASLMITLGLSFVAVSLLLLAFGDVPRTYPAVTGRAWDLGGVLVQGQYVLIAAVTVVSTLGLTTVLRYTVIGHALVACADQPRAAELVGLSTRTLGILSFAVAGGLGALAGGLLVPVLPMSYDSDVAIAINGFAAAAFGGLVSIRGAFLGGLVLGIAENLVVGYWEGQYQLAAALVIMLALIGWRSRHEVVT